MPMLRTPSKVEFLGYATCGIVPVDLEWLLASSSPVGREIWASRPRGSWLAADGRDGTGSVRVIVVVIFGPRTRSLAAAASAALTCTCRIRRRASRRLGRKGAIRIMG